MKQHQVRTYSSIMVQVDLLAAASHRVRLAQTLARRFGAHLIGIAAEEPFTAYDGETPVYVSPAIAEEERTRVSSDLARAERIFRASAGPGDDVEWRPGEVSGARFILSQSRAADLLGDFAHQEERSRMT